MLSKRLSALVVVLAVSAMPASPGRPIGTRAPAKAPAAQNLAAAPAPLTVAAPEIARKLLSALPAPPAGRVTEIVIDPLLDGRTGEQSEAGAIAGALIAEVVAREFPQFRVVEFSPASLARHPILLMGAIAWLDTAGQDTVEKQPASLPAKPTVMWFTAADTATHRVLSRAKAQVSMASIDSKPAAAQADNPVWRRDPRVWAYLKTCHNAKVGEEMEPAYVEQLEAAALLSQADTALSAKRYPQALAFYQKALAAAGGRQLRTLNGIYVSLDRLHRQKEAEQAFAQLIDFGLDAGELNVKLLFRPASANFVTTAQARSYNMWIREIADRSAARAQCLEVVGHTSPSGLAALNEQLSALRAEYVRGRLDRAKPGFGRRIITLGVGSRETIVGAGKDDASDAIDRRVEFKVLNCQ